MPDPKTDPKKTVKAPTNKYTGAKQVLSKKDIPASYVPSGKEGKREYFTETVEAPPAITPKPGTTYPPGKERKPVDPKEHEGFLIKQLKSGVTPEDLVKEGHATPGGIEKLKSFYQQKHLFLEPTETKAKIAAVGTGIQGSQIQNFANPQYDVKTLPDFESGGSWNKGKDVYVEKGTGKIVDLTKHKFEGQYYDGVKQGAFEPGYTGQTWDELSKAKGTKSQAISNQLGVTTTGDVKTADVVEVDPNVKTYMNTLSAGQGNAFQSLPINSQPTNTVPPSNAPIVEQYGTPKKKNGGLIGKIKGYAEGGQTSDNSAQVAGMAGAGAGLVGQYGSQAIDRATQDEQGRYTRNTYENDPTNGNLAKVFNKGTLSGGVEGAGKGAAMGASFGPQGALIGAGVGLLAGSIKGTIDANRDAKSIQGEADAIAASEAARKSAQQSAIYKANIDKQLLDRSQGLKYGGDVKETEMLQKRTAYPKPSPIKAPIVIKKTTVVVDKKGLEEQKKKLGYKDGGKIEGKGSGTSDSIEASVKANSFVVPSKNSDKAETIRRVVLGDKSKKANLSQSNGEKVKLSNGEHLFTPNEKEKIDDVLGDDALENLAPNAETSEEDEYKKGGPVPGQANPNMTPTVSTKAKSSNKSSKKAPVITPEYLQMRNSVLPVTQVEAEVSPNGSLDVSEQIGVDKTTGKQVNPMDLSKLGNVAEYAIPMLQAGYGLSQLKKLGKRPVGELDKDYLASIAQAQGNVDLANAQAKYGFTPEEQTLLNNQRAEATSAGRYAARNLSGGSAANAFNMERSLINQSTGQGLKAAVENRNLMLQKQGIAQDKQAYLDAMIANKASMSRQLFADKMNAWQQNQQAGSGLLAAGLNNMIGAKRYNDELAALKETQNIRNNPYGTFGQ